MNHGNEIRNLYRKQIQRCGRALATAQTLSIVGDLHHNDSVAQVKLFTDGNREKRFDKIRNQVEFVQDVFENFDDILAEYIQSKPLAAYDTGCSDGDRFLDWLENSRTPTHEQSDYIICQRSRHAIEKLARRRRMPHARFQEMWSVAERLIRQLETNRKLSIYLNPIRQWSTFQTGILLDDQEKAPVNVLFFACKDQIRTAFLDRSGQELIRVLEQYSRLTLAEWLALAPKFDEQELIDLCQEAADMGVLAFG